MADPANTSVRGSRREATISRVTAGVEYTSCVPAQTKLGISSARSPSR